MSGPWIEAFRLAEEYAIRRRNRRDVRRRRRELAREELRVELREEVERLWRLAEEGRLVVAGWPDLLRAVLAGVGVAAAVFAVAWAALWFAGAL